MSEFMNAVQAFIEDIKGETAWVEELNEHSHKITGHFDGASLDEINEALRRFAALFPDIPLVALGLVAINCGSLFERGGDPEIAGPGLLEQLPRIIETAGEFYKRCRALAVADALLIDELREAEQEWSGEDEPLSPVEIIDVHVSHKNWDKLALRFGPVLFPDHPAAVLGEMSERFFRLGLIAHLSRSKGLRAAARAQPDLLEGMMKHDDVAGWHRSFLVTMLQVLDNELLLVLHVEQQKGFDVRISGIADNFQLHTLLAGAIIGPPEHGWVEGEAPSPRALAECRDAELDQPGDYVTGAFNLCNYTALQPDGSLPNGDDSSDHWIWNEGWPSEIVPFEGRRIVLLGPPPYGRHWRAGRQFGGMPGELLVEKRLDTATVKEWLHRLRQAARQ